MQRERERKVDRCREKERDGQIDAEKERERWIDAEREKEISFMFLYLHLATTGGRHHFIQSKAVMFFIYIQNICF